MEQKTISEEVVVLPGPKEPQSGKFAQSYTYTPENEEILAKRGKIFAVVEVRGGPEIDLSLAGKLVWDSLNEEYYSDLSGPPLAALEKALSSSSAKLLSLAQKEKEKGAAETYYDLSLAVGVLWGEVVYAARVGEPVVFLERGRHVRKLLSEETPLGVASGIAQERDILVLGSKTLREILPPTLETVALLEKEFEKTSPVPGMAGILIKISLVPATQTLSLKAPSSQKGKLPSPSWSFLKGKIERIRDRLGLWRIRGIGRLPTLNLKLLIGLLILAFAASTIFSILKAREQAKLSEFGRLILVVEEKLKEAEGLIDFNNARAYEIYNEASSDFERARALLPNDPRAGELEGKLSGVLSRIEKAALVSEEALFVDLSLFSADAQILSLSINPSFIFAVDEISGSAFKITFSSPPTISDLTPAEGKGAKYTAADGIYVYLSGPEGFSRIDLGSGRVDSDILSFDKFPLTSGVDDYSGNLYLLVPQDGQIYRFLVTAGGYGAGKPWIKDGTDISQALDFSIDGGVWVLEKDELSYFFGGEKDPFGVSGLAVPMSGAQKIFKKDYTQNVYVLEPSAQRILLFAPDGRFLRQFKGEVLKNATDLAVSSDEKALYFSAGSKIYRVEL